LPLEDSIIFCKGLAVEAVEKTPKHILGRDAEKSDLIECTTINDLMLGKGQETPESHPLIVMLDFFYRLVGWQRAFQDISLCYLG
jgi:hypothetical protein